MWSKANLFDVMSDLLKNVTAGKNKHLNYKAL